jgi:release factor glutamine methyltransferase
MQETVRTLLDHATETLATTSPTGALDAQVLLAAALGRPRTWVTARPELVPEAAQRERFVALVARRRAGEPVAYLRGEREFWSLQLRVTPDVLVPRPETETVVEAVLARIEPDAAHALLDLGTGSGAIAIAVARERPRCTVTATDLSASALAVARANALALGADNVRFAHGAWYDAVPHERFRLIASNPPYVMEADPVIARGELRYEPALALAGGADGLRDLRAVIAGAPAHLEPGGMLVVEHGADQRDAVHALMHAAGFELIQCYADLAGLDRVSAARLGSTR